MACTSSARVTLIVPRVHLAEKQFVGSDGAAMAIPIGLEAGKHFPELPFRLVQAASYNVCL